MNLFIILIALLLFVGIIPIKFNKPQEPQKIAVTQTADVIKDTTGLVMCDKAIGITELTMPEVEWIIFSYDKDMDLMKFNTINGEIYWKDRLVTTDKELVEGLKDIILENRCPECKKSK